jgi:hypothetical protein
MERLNPMEIVGILVAAAREKPIRNTKLGGIEHAEAI